MKAIVFLSFVLFLASAQAEISNSNYNPRHQSALEQASFDACGVGFGRLHQLSSTEAEHEVDQGNIDLYFHTELEMTVRVDQGAYDTYRVTAHSAMHSAYDHNAKDWGIYSVNILTCKLQ